MGSVYIPLYSLLEGTAGVQVFPVSHRTLVEHLADEPTAPHRHDHYNCLFIEHGSVDLLIDFHSVHLPAGSLLVSPPGPVHQLGATLGFQGWVLAADAKLISPHARASIEQALASVVLLQLQATESTWFQQLFSALHALDKERHGFALGAEVRQSLLNACLCQAAVLLEVRENQQAQAHTARGIALTKQFRRLVQQHFLTLKKPADYAARLHLTVSYLNDTIKAVTGFSVSHFIQQEILAEAQRLLFYTDLSIKEVAEKLGYEDPKYFMRLFGKRIGISPTTFRHRTAPDGQPGRAAAQ